MSQRSVCAICLIGCALLGLAITTVFFAHRRSESRASEVSAVVELEEEACLVLDHLLKMPSCKAFESWLVDRGFKTEAGDSSEMKYSRAGRRGHVLWICFSQQGAKAEDRVDYASAISEIRKCGDVVAAYGLTNNAGTNLIARLASRPPIVTPNP